MKKDESEKRNRDQLFIENRELREKLLLWDKSLDKLQFLQNFQEELELKEEPFSLMEKLSSSLGLLFDTGGMAFYLTDENMEFIQQYVTPRESVCFFEKNFESMVNEGVFASALEQDKPIAIEIKPDNPLQVCTLILCPLKKQRETTGMIFLFLKTAQGRVTIQSLELLGKMSRIAAKVLDYLQLKMHTNHYAQELATLSAYKKNMISHITDGLIVMDCQWNIQEINRSGANLFGFSESELAGKDFRKLFPPENETILNRIEKKILNAGEIRNVELEIMTPFKEKIPINFSASIFQNRFNQDEGIVAILKDMTEIRGLIQGLEEARHRIEEQNTLLEEKVRIRTAELIERINEIKNLSEFNINILQNIGSGVLGLDEKIRVNTFNKASSEITGIEENEMLDRPLTDFPRLQSLIQLAYQTLASRKNIQGLELIIQNASHSKEVTLSVSASVLYTPLKEVRGVMMVFADITAIREMHKKLLETERMAALGKMAAGVAHEIRNPLNVIRGLSELVTQKKPDQAKLEKYMNSIMSEIDRLEILLKEMVDYIKQRSPQFEKIQLETILSEMIEMFREGVVMRSVKEIELIWQAPSSVSPVLADRGQIQQVLLNLLKNAMDAIEKEGRITVSLFEQDNIVVLTVEDDGCGMDEFVLEHSMDAFFTTKVSTGTGLGLSIVKNIMDLHKGTIQIESRLGKGTTFYLKFPKEAI
ncbi:MAG: PAS domain S-box protein [Candidatus Aureabacteria bacterium]|nr:PAS domain S-box protein [Candidatus Auribacterota bacterium]